MNRIVLLADFEAVRNMGNRFHGKQAQLDYSDLFMALAIVAAVIVAAVILTRLTRRQDHQPHFSSLRGLFNELCQAHGLDRARRRLLRRLAASQGLDQPSRLFLEADRWNPRDLPSNLVQYTERYQALYEQLFAMEIATATDPREGSAATAASTLVVNDVVNTASLAVPMPDLLPPPGFGTDVPVLGR